MVKDHDGYLHRYPIKNSRRTGNGFSERKRRKVMLILSRKPGEIIRIGDDITITISEVKGNHVRVGIQAPRDIEVHREEIYRKIQAEKT